MFTLLSVILGYLIGSISTSTIISKQIAHIDIREHGSGNAGATNTLRVLGTKWGILVLLLDAIKGMIAIYIAYLLTSGHSTFALYLSAIAAVIGHNWPIFFGFRGGKGVATTIGVFLVLIPIPALLAGIIAIVVVLISRYVSLGALIFTIFTPIFVAILNQKFFGSLLFASIIAVLSIYRHRENIIRLSQGRENKIFSKKL